VTTSPARMPAAAVAAGRAGLVKILKGTLPTRTSVPAWAIPRKRTTPAKAAKAVDSRCRISVPAVYKRSAPVGMSANPRAINQTSVMGFLRTRGLSASLGSDIVRIKPRGLQPLAFRTFQGANLREASSQVSVPTNETGVQGQQIYGRNPPRPDA